MARSNRRISDIGQCSVSSSILQVAKLLLLVLISLLAAVASASNAGPATSADTDVQVVPADAPAQQPWGPEGDGETHSRGIRKNRIVLFLLALVLAAVFRSLVTAKNDALLKVRSPAYLYAADPEIPLRPHYHSLHEIAFRLPHLESSVTIHVGLVPLQTCIGQIELIKREVVKGSS